jgi:sensor histidine kinase YesM
LFCQVLKSNIAKHLRGFFDASISIDAISGKKLALRIIIMTLKKRFYIVAFISIILAALSFIFKDVQSELPIFLNLLLGGVILYMLLFYLFQTGHLKPYLTNRADKIIAYIFGISMLVYGINLANRVDDNIESFWVINGNIWLADLFAAIILMSVFYIIFSWAFDKWKKIETLKNEKSKAELRLLKSQINPHFFFNTLNNLYSLIKKDPDTAQEYVLKLSDMMRFTIYDGKEESVSLEKELKYLTNFIELQTARYHNIIDIKFKHEVKSPARTIPPLLFIILVENAFKHGVEKLIADAFIHIDFIENDTRMVFKIENNFDPDDNSKLKGIGLKNLKERLDLLYPNSYKLTNSTAENIYFAQLELNIV